jgi:hypothetical protein
LARVPLIYISRRAAKQKSDSASSHIKVPRYFERRPERVVGTLQRYAVGNAKCARFEEAGAASLTFKKRGQR